MSFRTNTIDLQRARRIQKSRNTMNLVLLIALFVGGVVLGLIQQADILYPQPEIGEGVSITVAK